MSWNENDNPVPSSQNDAVRNRNSVSLFAPGIPPVLHARALTGHGWLCVGIEDELEGISVNRLVAACIVAGYTAAWAVEVPWNVDQETTRADHLLLTIGGVEGLTKSAYIGSCYVMEEDSGNFRITSDGDLYWMLAGERDFIEMVCQKTVMEQNNIFRKFVDRYQNPFSLASSRLSAVQSAIDFNNNFRSRLNL